VYDALGRRVRQYAGAKGQTNFTYQGEDVLLDDANGTLTKYLNGPGIDNKLRQTTGSSSSYFLADHLGSTNGLTDSTGALTASNSYDSFGNPTNASVPTRYQFTGREFDQTTGLQFSRARWYDPAIGRFISEDPIGFGGGDINLYGYVWNNPQHYRDPSGNIGVAAVAYAIFEFCATGYDFYDFYSTLSDPDSDFGDISLSGGGILLGTVAPGGGYGRLGKSARKYFGRRGNPATRDQLDDVRDQFLDNNPNYRHVGGGRNRVTGDDIREEYLPNPSGGRKGSSYADLTFEGPDGSRIRINTYDSNMIGLPSARETEAADRLFRNGRGSPVVLVPKRRCIPCNE
jgi:RHS repeat-associated protein